MLVLITLTLGLCLAALTREPVTHRHRIVTTGLVALGALGAGAATLIATVIFAHPLAPTLIATVVAIAINEQIAGVPASRELARADAALSLGSVVGAVAVAGSAHSPAAALLAWAIVGRAGGVALRLSSSGGGRWQRSWASLGIVAGAAIGLTGSDDLLGLVAGVAMMVLIVSARVLGSPERHWGAGR